MNQFTQRVIQIIQDIPSGYIMTYGQIAKEAGNPRAARQVARILHSMSQKHNLPWHRVVNAKGEIVIKNEEGVWTQRTLLEKEGISVQEGKVVVEQYRFDKRT
ncbi:MULTISPECIES: methylated-DNA--[protein]-cysteine S-methyltransferase [Bacillaceae]|uniref:MGMT family protein n=1 Tax=Bacillaceae TaxID=186817 RepID=UPI001047A1EB|nr:methylated-DNA--[protein]-cysteine S-methyltransferase [Bacillus sp. CBEL-1]TDB50114.1 methylated-DNA--[protein]-cysteine S-methyltransferase [Bacillus sp. CBEL-1]